MSRYGLPLGIIGFIVLIFVLIFLGGDGPKTNYAEGDSSEPPISAEWVKGNQAATVKLVEYSDFQCPACAKYYQLIKQLEGEFGDRVAFVYRHYPLYQIHPNADIAARAAEAAGIQGRFWQMHDLLFDRQGSWSALLNPKSTFEEYAAEIGLDVAKFTIDLESESLRKEVASDYQRGARINVKGTPTFVINGVKQAQNPGSLEEFRTLLMNTLSQELP